jgi:hypothetical protein
MGVNTKKVLMRIVDCFEKNQREITNALDGISKIDFNALVKYKEQKECYDTYNSQIKQATDFKTNLSFSERIALIPKYDIDVLYGYILLERLLQNKLHTNDYGERLWKKFAGFWNNSMQGVLSPEQIEASNNISWQIDIPYSRDALKSDEKEKFIHKLRNSIAHELPYEKALEYDEAPHNILTVDELRKIYEFILTLS